MESKNSINFPENKNLDISISEISKVFEYFDAAPFSELNYVVKNILAEAVREISEFRAERTNLTKVSLNVRNIFELYLIGKHVYNDDSALKSWCGQMHKDLHDVLVGFKDLAITKNLNVVEVEEIINFSNLSLSKSAYESKSGFNIKEIAKKYGYEKDYGFVYKLSSKLVHPTSMKVNGYPSLEEDNLFIAVLTYCGIFFSQRLEELALQIKEGKKT